MESSFFSVLLRLFTKRDKKIISVLLFSSVLVSVIETIGVSAIMIFVSVATNVGAITKSKFFTKLYTFLDCKSHSEFVVILGVLLLLFYAVRLVVNALHVYYMSKFAHMRQYHFSTRMFQKYLLFRYADFAGKNSSTINQVIFSFTSNITQIISAMLSIAAESFTVICIYAMLFFVNWKMTLALTLLLAVQVYLVLRIFSARIRAAGKKSQQFSLQMGRVWHESYGNYKFLKLLAQEGLVRDHFAASSKAFAQANIVNTVWQSLPRFVLETMGFSILIGVMIYVVARYNDATFVIPIVSMYALAFYRFLPSVNKIMQSYNQIMFNKHAPQPVFDFLQHEFEELGNGVVTFNQTITVNNLSFAYSEKSKVFEHASLVITKGQRVGLVGESGSGKSTLADIMMGLLTPQSGAIEIDGIQLTQANIKNWRQKIGYIPQSIYLFDGTVSENVACGRDINEQKIVAVLKKARLYDFLMAKDGIQTLVGEGGIRLSGGQKQRVAIARALYDDPKLLVLDEATSALDNETESIIMNEIYDVSADKTLLIIAHRLTTIERCDKVYKIERGHISDATRDYVIIQNSEMGGA